MKKVFINYFVFILLLLVVFAAFWYWYEFASKKVGFLYSTKDPTYKFLESYNGSLKIYSYNEETFDENDIRTLKSKGINIIIGPMYSSSAQKLLPFLEEYDLVAFSPTVSSMRILQSTDRLFTFIPSNDFQFDAIVNFLKAQNVKKVFIFLDSFNKEYSEEFLDIFDYIPGNYAYYYNLNSLIKRSNLNFNEYDAIVITTSPRAAVDIVEFLNKNYEGILLLTDSGVGLELTKIVGKKDNVYIVSFAKDPLNYSAELTQEVFNLVESHRFISARQMINYYMKIENLHGQYFDRDGALIREIKIVCLSDL
ncbi:MAG: ABC transporter substrate-binding protein [Thermosipho sp. (in: Bacteria)]|nr:ABC transporter substrate-binding protein [Thermosipho sp. (in: thermotogales)]